MGDTYTGDGPDGRMRREVNELLEQLDVDGALASRANDDAPGLAPAREADLSESDVWSRAINAFYNAKYGVPIVYMAGVADSDKMEGGTTYTMVVVGYVLPLDHDPKKVVALFDNGAYYGLSRPHDQEGKRRFMLDFMPGGPAFILNRPDEPLTASEQFLRGAEFDVYDLLRYDHPSQVQRRRANEALELAVRRAPGLTQERLQAKAQSLGQASLLLEEIYPPDDNEE